MRRGLRGSGPPLCDAGPEARIILVNQESATVVVQESHIGAPRYAAKKDLIRMLAAMDAVLDGRRLLSAALSDKI